MTIINRAVHGTMTYPSGPSTGDKTIELTGDKVFKTSDDSAFFMKDTIDSNLHDFLGAHHIGMALLP